VAQSAGLLQAGWCDGKRRALRPCLRLASRCLGL